MSLAGLILVILGILGLIKGLVFLAFPKSLRAKSKWISKLPDWERNALSLGMVVFGWFLIYIGLKT